MPNLATDPGFVTFNARCKAPDQPTEVVNFGAGFAVRILAGAQFLRRIRIVGRGEFELSEVDLYDGKIVAAPRGFERVWLDWSADAIANVARVVLEVLTEPAAVWAVTDSRGAMASRILFESPLHLDPSGSVPSVAALGGELVVADVLPGDAYQGPEGIQTGGTIDAYPHRAIGDERPRWWPTAGLYFDGWIGLGSAGTPTPELYIYAYSFSGAGTPTLHFYRQLTAIQTDPGTSSVSPTTTHVLRLADVGAASQLLPLPVPPDGFKMVLRNAHATNAFSVYGRIGARSG